MTRAREKRPACRLGLFPRADAVVPSFDGFQGLSKRLLQVPLADNSKEDADGPPLKVLALAHNLDVHVGRPVGLPYQVVGVPRATSPQVGVSSGENDAVGIRPVVMQSFPDAARALRDIGAS